MQYLCPRERIPDTPICAVPFTPSQGIITPSPIAATHYDQQVLMYPFTPQGPAPVSLPCHNIIDGPCTLAYLLLVNQIYIYLA